VHSRCILIKPKGLVFILNRVVEILLINTYLCIIQKRNFALKNKTLLMLTLSLLLSSSDAYADVTEMLKDSLVIADKLETCESYTGKRFALSDKPLRIRVHLQRDGKCLYRSQLQNNKVLECAYSKEERLGTSKFLRDTVKNQNIVEKAHGRKTVEIPEETMRKIEVQKDIKPLPSDMALRKGICKITEQKGRLYYF